MKAITGGVYILGLATVLFSLVRWTITYSDVSQAVLGSGIGILIIVFAFLFQMINDNHNELQELSTAFDVMNNKYYLEIERLKKK